VITFKTLIDCFHYAIVIMYVQQLVAVFRSIVMCYLTIHYVIYRLFVEQIQSNYCRLKIIRK